MSTPIESEHAADAVPLDQLDERLIAQRGVSGQASAFLTRVRSGDLGSLPVVVGLVVIWAAFALLNPNFLSSRNLVNLTLQSAAVGTIAIGVVLVLLLGEIDLSVGSVSGLSAAVLAVLFVQQDLPLIIAIIAALAAGMAIGAVYGMLYTSFGVPSFVVTLAGLLAVLGLQLFVLGDTGTVNLPFDSGIVRFSQSMFLTPGTAYALVLVAVLVNVATHVFAARRRAAAGLSVTPITVIVLRAAAIGAVLLVGAFVLNQDRGVGLSFVLFVLLVVFMDLMLRKTQWGRDIFAVGGNVEAARRAGIKVRRVYLQVFILTSTFAALGGVLAAGRLAASNQASGGADTNLNAIAAAVIGGTSLFGGRGSAYSALLGILVIQSISNGLTLLNLDSSIRFMVTGGVLLVAVIVDALSRRGRARAGIA